jgi:hypothetical protein
VDPPYFLPKSAYVYFLLTLLYSRPMNHARRYQTESESHIASALKEMGKEVQALKDNAKLLRGDNGNTTVAFLFKECESHFAFSDPLMQNGLALGYGLQALEIQREPLAVGSKLGFLAKNVEALQHEVLPPLETLEKEICELANKPDSELAATVKQMLGYTANIRKHIGNVAEIMYDLDSSLTRAQRRLYAPTPLNRLEELLSENRDLQVTLGMQNKTLRNEPDPATDFSPYDFPTGMPETRTLLELLPSYNTFQKQQAEIIGRMHIVLGELNDPAKTFQYGQNLRELRGMERTLRDDLLPTIGDVTAEAERIRSQEGTQITARQIQLSFRRLESNLTEIADSLGGLSLPTEQRRTGVSIYQS